jgi:hypothetical protein
MEKVVKENLAKVIVLTIDAMYLMVGVNSIWTSQCFWILNIYIL